MQWSGGGASKDSDAGSGVSKNGDHSRRTAAIRFHLLSSRQRFQHTQNPHSHA